MHRYEELEKKYYKRLYLKYFSYFVIILIVGLGGYLLYSLNTKQNKIKKPKENNITKVKTIQKQTKETKKVIKKDINKTEIKKSIVKTKIKKDVNKTKNTAQEVMKFSIPKIQEIKPVVVKKENVNKKSQKKLQKNNIKVTKINLKESQVDINTLKLEYNKNPSFELAITISKLYFNKKDLVNAKFWALKANNIDPNDYRSWEMFAKILLKKGKKDKAKEVLKVYLNDYGYNQQIDNLLRSIQ